MRNPKTKRSTWLGERDAMEVLQEIRNKYPLTDREKQAIGHGIVALDHLVWGEDD